VTIFKIAPILMALAILNPAHAQQAPFRIQFSNQASGFAIESETVPRIGSYNDVFSASDLQNFPDSSTFNLFSRSLSFGGFNDFGTNIGINGTSVALTAITINPSFTSLRQIQGSALSTDVKLNPVFPSATSGGNVSTFSNIIDRLTFGSLDPSINAGRLRITYAFDVRSTTNVLTEPLSSASVRNLYRYSSQLQLFDDFNHIFGVTGNSIFNNVRMAGVSFSNSPNSQTCPFGDICITDGFYSDVLELNVELDDVLYISNSILSQISTNARTFNGSISGLQTLNPGGQGINNINSYLLVEVLTPGFDYLSGSGTRYLTDIPRSAIPEADQWTMMIFGFFIVGSAMRRRRGLNREASRLPLGQPSRPVRFRSAPFWGTSHLLQAARCVPENIKPSRALASC
jgi:hypothetical protein